jgi:hypothetical protein
MSGFHTQEELPKQSRRPPMSLSFLSPFGRKLNDGYPKQVESWANRLKSSVSKDELADLKKKYEDFPLRRSSARQNPKNKPKKRR